MLAAATAAATVTAKSRASCRSETPPKSDASTNIGAAATRSRPTRSRLPPSLPRTSWASPSRLTSRSSSVRRSFSTPTASTATSEAASIAITSWSGARIRSSVAPKRATSPTVTTACEPVTTSQQVATTPKTAAAAKARATYSPRVRGATRISRSQTAPRIIRRPCLAGRWKPETRIVRVSDQGICRERVRTRE